MSSINNTLANVGEGLSTLFDSLSDPMGNFLIVIGIAGGMLFLFRAIATMLRFDSDDYKSEEDEEEEEEMISECIPSRPTWESEHKNEIIFAIIILVLIVMYLVGI